MKTLPKTYPFLIAVLFFTACTKDNSNPPQPPIVDAGPAQIIKLPVNSVTLSGSATSTDSKIKAYLWSEVSGPNVPVIASEGSKTTSVTGLTGGVYLFQLMAVDSLGETGVDTLSVTVSASTVTLVLGGTKETTFICNANTTSGNPAPPEVLAETWTINAITVYGRSFFQFDMSSIPTNVPVKSATLSLFSNPTPDNGDLIHANYGTTNDFFIQRVAGAWDPITTTWLTQPAVDTVGQVHVPQTSQAFLDVTVDVTTIVNNMLTSGNNGFTIRLNTEAIYNSRIFCSGIYTDPTKRPKLTINY